ncbi:MAG TPA: rhomboid family intramembrane serine protease [Gemmatimonadales bacterium]
MRSSPSYRVTPWVGRLIIANAVVLLLLMTLFTSRDLFSALQFSPNTALTRPWTFVSYMFVHAGLLHLLANMLMLYVFGTAVETRMGSRHFILYYLYCGVGAAVFSLLLAGIMPVGAFVGASGAVLGVAVAFAYFWPEAELIVFPIPFPIKARTLVIGLVIFDVVAWRLWPNDGIAHLAHVGGAMFGYLFFRVQTLSRKSPTQPARALERVVMVQSGASEPDRRTPATPSRPRRRIDADPVAAEVDRVLDKISEKGLSSLTDAERRFLAEVAKHKKGEK